MDRSGTPRVTQAADFRSRMGALAQAARGPAGRNPTASSRSPASTGSARGPARFSDAPGAWAGRRLGCLGPARRRRGATTRRRGDQGQAPLRPDTRAGGECSPGTPTACTRWPGAAATTSCARVTPDNGLRTAFRGTPAYAPEPRWVIRGRYRPFETPRDTTVGSVVEGLQHVYAAPGAVEFEVGGQPLALTAFNGPRRRQPAHPVHRRDKRRHHLRGEPVAGRSPRRTRTAPWSLTSTGRPTCRAPTPSSPTLPACPRQRTASRSRWTRASKTPTRPASRPDRSPVCR